MNLRHAAALALVGWYLMTPPWKPLSATPRLDKATDLASILRPHLETDAPLSKWETYAASDSAEECEEMKMATVQLAGKEKLTVEKDGTLTERAQRALMLNFQLQYATCVSTDDPRLKEK